MGKPKPSEQAVAEVIAALREAGWSNDGHTATETVRVGTARSPVYGGIGGELSTTGGRTRLRLPDTERYVTVGPRTTCFYEMVGTMTRAGFAGHREYREPGRFKNFRTMHDLVGIVAEANRRQNSDPRAGGVDVTAGQGGAP